MTCQECGSTLTPKDGLCIDCKTRAGSTAHNVVSATPGTTGYAEWYCMVDGRRAGPYLRAELMHRLAEGQITAATLVWRGGMDQAVPLCALNGVQLHEGLPGGSSRERSSRELHAAPGDTSYASGEQGRWVHGSDVVLPVIVGVVCGFLSLLGWAASIPIAPFLLMLMGMTFSLIGFFRAHGAWAVVAVLGILLNIASLAISVDRAIEGARKAEEMGRLLRGEP